MVMYQLGLSPRLRGSQPYGRGVGREDRSIPAFAGEPDGVSCLLLAGRVYPRVCGGTLSCGMTSTTTYGLSPRVRGNLVLRDDVDYHVRSIPACAGEPRRGYSRRRKLWVYPRVCGGMPVYPRVCGGTPWRIDTFYFISFASLGRGVAMIRSSSGVRARSSAIRGNMRGLRSAAAGWISG